MRCSGRRLGKNDAAARNGTGASTMVEVRSVPAPTRTYEKSFRSIDLARFPNFRNMPDRKLTQTRIVGGTAAHDF
jgi:hypothetical protein